MAAVILDPLEDFFERVFCIWRSLDYAVKAEKLYPFLADVKTVLADFKTYYPEFKGNVATVYTNPISQGGASNGHDNGNAKTYMDVGLAMGEAMVELMK